MPQGAADVVTSRNPETGALVAETPVSSPEEIKRVVQRARDAFGPWSSLPVKTHGVLGLLVGGAASPSTGRNAPRRGALVERGVEAELLSALTRRVESLRLGDPAEPATTLGPLITPPARARADAELERAVGSGAEVVSLAPELNDPRLDDAGFFRAALVRGIPAEDPLRRRELFAPVLSVESFDSDDDAWRIANDTPYGLAAAVYTSSAARIGAAQERL